MNSATTKQSAQRDGGTAAGKVTIPVSGMTCAACSGRVQRALEKQSGVEKAAVNLMLRNATVEFDPATTSPDALVEAIRATGYGAELAPEGSLEEKFLALTADRL